MLNNIVAPMSKEKKFGLQGERWAMEKLEKRGYQVTMVSDFFSDIDLVIDGVLACEVKIALPRVQRVRPGYWRHRWQFDCSRLPQSVDSLVILIAEDTAGFRYPFCVPSYAIIGRGTKTPTVTSHPLRYSGWLAEYRDSWSQVDSLLSLRQRQSGQYSLFQELWGKIETRSVDAPQPLEVI